MHTNRLSTLDDATLRRALNDVVATERSATADVLSHIAEFDARRLYAPEGCPSMHDYCVRVLRLSDGAAYKRIHAARAARRFPRLLDELAAGRLHLAALCLLAPHLTPGNVDELVALATSRTKLELEVALARHAAPKAAQAPAPVASTPALDLPDSGPPEAAPRVDSPPSGAVDRPTASEPPRLVRITIDGATEGLLDEVRDLLGPSARDANAVIRRALETLRAAILRRKAGATPRPRVPRATLPRGRGIANHVRRAVWNRDGGRCTFTSDGGRRCGATRGVEFDHVVPFARGGEATVDGLRLRCRTHNRLEAERAYGAGFVQSRIAHARMRRAAAPAPDRDVESALRTLGTRAAEARRAALHTATLHGVALDERIRAALRFVGAGDRARLAAGPA